MKRQINIFKTILLSCIFILLSCSLLYGQTAPFITVWDTEEFGDSNNNQIKVPASGDWDYEWEEVNNPSNNGISSSTVSDETTITFPTPGKYRLKMFPNDIYGNAFHQIQFAGEIEAFKFLDIEQWGNVQWSSFLEAFSGCTNLIGSATDVPNLSQVSNMELMFNSADSFNGDVSNWDVEQVTNMQQMFSGAYEFNQDLNSWNVINVTNMMLMFNGAGKFNGDISSWEVGQVQTMAGMFEGANKFNGNIEGWDVGQVIDMQFMFSGASQFNGGIEGWDVGQVKSMTNMFKNAAEFNRNIGGWDVSQLGVNQSGSTNNISFEGSGLSDENYSRILLGWANNPNTNDGIIMDAIDLNYCQNIDQYRDSLINALNWTINGDNQGACILSTDQLSVTQFTVYPNPVRQEITIEGLQGKETIRLVDMTGRVLQFVKNDGADSSVLQIEELANGIYNLIIQEGESQIVKKIVKQ